MDRAPFYDAATRTKLLLIDDDAGLLAIRKMRFEAEGYEVKDVDDSSRAIEAIAAFEPGLVMLDLMLPKVSGEDLIRLIREDKRYDAVKIVVNTAKSFESDYKFCLESGADAYLTKPVEHDDLSKTIRKLLRDETTVAFWGTRGSIPRPGEDTLKFGGNTPCVSIELSKDRLFVFDAGTGIVNLGRKLLKEKKHYKFNLFISHPHWDHIQGLPFFQPLYKQGNEMVIHGTNHGKLSLREVISGQMDSLYFPVTIKEYSSRLYFKELEEGDYEIEHLGVSTIGLNHPGKTLGYRLTGESGKTVAYITDHEIFPESDAHNRERLVAFVENVDVLIHDATYFDEEYPTRVGWGHSALSEVLKLAADAKAKNLFLFHHEPHHDDEAIERKEAIGRRFFEERGLDVHCSAAREGSSITI
jgi:phosphoribosyl 1,2-cyclic phosphodiesterase/CheY-like chemotaxis protein